MNSTEIKRKREAMGLSMQEFGEQLGMTKKGARSTVWRWENANQAPSPQALMLIKNLPTPKRKKQ